MQANPAVAGEHRNAFRQVIERLALEADHFFEAPFEIEPLGDIVEHIGHAAVGIGR